MLSRSRSFALSQFGPSAIRTLLFGKIIPKRPALQVSSTFWKHHNFNNNMDPNMKIFDVSVLSLFILVPCTL